MTAERTERGRYLYGLAGCDGCHSPRDWSRFAGPVLPAHRGEGVESPPVLGLADRVGSPVTQVDRATSPFPQAAAPEAQCRPAKGSANITTDPETGLGAWSDGEKIQAIRQGIDRNGRRLAPVMPYNRYRWMSDEDVCSLVAYLNTLPPRKHSTRRPAALFPVIRFAASPGLEKSVPAPARGDPVEYGKYLVTIAGCRGCHSAGPESRSDLPFAGGRLFHLGGGTVASANITPEPHTGIGRWSEQDWLDRVYRYQQYAEGESPKVGPQSLTVMPWLELSRLRAADLKAIYRYLRAQKPVYRLIDQHPVSSFAIE